MRPRTSHTRLIGRRRVPLLHDVSMMPRTRPVHFVGVQEFALLLSGRRGVILVESVEYAVSICTLASKTAMHETCGRALRMCSALARERLCHNRRSTLNRRVRYVVALQRRCVLHRPQHGQSMPPALGDTLGAIARVRRAHLLHDRHMTVTWPLPSRA